MSVQSVSASDSASAAWWAELLKKRKEAQDSESAGTLSVAGQSANMEVSPMAQMLSKLDSLAKSDPEKFKEVTATIAAKISEAAKSATGKDAEFLSRMAEQFTAASESGDVASLQPPSKPQRPTYEGTDDEPSGAMPPPPGGRPGGPSDDVRSILDEIFDTISSL